MNFAQGSEQATMIVPSGAQAKVTPAPEALIPASSPPQQRIQFLSTTVANDIDWHRVTPAGLSSDVQRK